MMDRDNADFRSTLGQIRDELTSAAMPVHVPIGSAADFSGFVDLLTMKAHTLKGGDKGAATVADAPADVASEVEDLREELVEAIVSGDDDLLEAYFEGEELDPGRVGEVFAEAIRTGDIVPVFCGSCQTSAGVPALMDRIVGTLPLARPGRAPDGGMMEAARCRWSREPGRPRPRSSSRRLSEPHVGDLSYFRVFSGRITNGVTLANPDRSASERIAHIAIPHGSRRIDVDVLNPGDIGVVTKLKDTHTGDTLCDDGRQISFGGIEWPMPDLSLAVTACTRADEDKIGSGLAKLHEEDPTFSSGYDSRARTDDHPRARGDPPQHLAREDDPEVRGQRGHPPAQHRLPRDDHEDRGGPGAPQEAVGRPGAVRRLPHPAQPVAARRRVPVRR